MYPLIIVEIQPLGRSFPDALSILVIFLIDGSMHSFHFTVPPGRFLGNEVVGDVFLGQITMENAPELAAVIGLYREDIESEIPLGILECQNRILAFFALKYAEMILMGERIEY